jgi:hypothetical protein
MGEPPSPIALDREGIYLSLQPRGTWVEITITRRDPTDAMQILITPEEAGDLAAWLIVAQGRSRQPERLTA